MLTSKEEHKQAILDAREWINAAPTKEVRNARKMWMYGLIYSSDPQNLIKSMKLIKETEHYPWGTP